MSTWKPVVRVRWIIEPWAGAGPELTHHEDVEVRGSGSADEIHLAEQHADHLAYEKFRAAKELGIGEYLQSVTTTYLETAEDAEEEMCNYVP